MAVETIRDLMDEDGENRAIRSFLMQYQTPGITTVAMRRHMELSGWEGCWPTWVAEARAGDHLTKAGAQLWIRHLIQLEVGVGQ
jgi:hypothetical protein